MKKQTAKIVTLLLTIVCAVCLAMGLAGCKTPGSSNGNNAAETKYDAIYDAYAEVVGNDALGHDEWYEVYMDSIDKVELGEFQVESYSLVTDNGKNYVEFVIGNKIYLLDLSGSDFTQNVAFVLTVTKKNGDVVGDVNLDIYNVSTGKTWRTDKTASDGTVRIYVPAADSNTYGVKVSATGNSSSLYSIPEGAEPTFSVSSQSTSVSVVLDQVITYVLQVRDALGSGIQNVALGVYRTDGGSDVEIAYGVTGASGNLTLFLVLEEGATYVIKIRDVEDALPEGYHAEEEEYSLDLVGRVTRITLVKGEQNYDFNVEAEEEITAQETGLPTHQPIAIEANSDLETFMHKDEDGYYMLDSLGTYSTLYVALDYPLAQVMGKNVTIYDLLQDNDNAYLFVKKVPHTSDGLTEDEAILENIWDRYIYTDMLLEYCKNANPDGLYPLNNDLLGFLKACAYLFNGYTGADTDWQLAVVYYDGPVLGLGPDAAMANVNVAANGTGISSTAIKLRSGLPTGLYSLKLFTTASWSSKSNYFVKVDSHYYPLYYGALKGETGSKHYEVIIYLTEGVDTQILVCMAYSYSAITVTSVQLDKWTENEDTVLTQPTNEITTTGEYEFALLPEGFYYYDLAVRLPERMYYSYTVELAEELPAGVSSVTMYSIYYGANNNGNGVVLPTDTTSFASKSLTSTSDSYSKSISTVFAANLMAPGIYFTYSGTDIITIKVKVTISLARININYDAGEGSGTIASATSQIVGNSYTLSSGVEMYKDDYILVGWLDPVSGTVYALGEIITLPDYDLNLVAQWKLDQRKKVDDELSVGNSVTTDYSSDYTTIEIPFGVLTEGNYLLIADFGANIGDVVAVNISGRSVSLLFSEERSTMGHYVYIMFVSLSADDRAITFNVSSEVSTTLSVSLGQPAVELKAGETTAVPFGPYGQTADEAYKITFGSSVEAGSSYKLTVSAYPGAAFVTFIATFSEGITSSQKNLGISVSSATYLTTTITLPADLDGAYLTLWARAASSGLTSFTIVNIKLEKVYTVSYVLGEDSTGSISDTATYNDGDTVTVKTNVPTNPDGIFKGWSLNGESVYNEAHESEYLHGGDTTTVNGKNVVLTAVWQYYNFSKANLGLGEEKKAEHVEFNSDEYYATRISLSEVLEGDYLLTFDFGSNDVGSRIAYYIGRSTTVINLVRSAKSTDEHHIYISYLSLAKTDKFLDFKPENISETVTATVIIEEFEIYEIQANGNWYDVPYSVWGSNYRPATTFSVNVNITEAGKYKITLKNDTGIEYDDDVYLYIGDNMGLDADSGRITFAFDSETDPNITDHTKNGVTDIENSFEFEAGLTMIIVSAFGNNKLYNKAFNFLQIKLEKID